MERTATRDGRITTGASMLVSHQRARHYGHRFSAVGERIGS